MTTPPRALFLLLALAGCNAGPVAAVDASAADAYAAGDGSASPECPQADDFLDVSTGSAGEGYAAPTLSVTCVGTEVVVATNGIPNFEFTAVTPNALQAVAQTMRFPRAPAAAAVETDVPLVGTTAVAVNGMPIFGPTEAPMMGYHDPLLDGILDYCNGHTAPGGMYHFHARPDCLFTDLEGNTSLVVAYAFDGYPILAPFACDDGACTATHELTSSWQRVASQFDASGDPLYSGTSEGAWDVFEYVEGSGDLDRCNGRALEGGGYAYYATDTFPYFIGCYHGTPTANGMRP
jgi:hypothetical protein